MDSWRKMKWHDEEGQLVVPSQEEKLAFGTSEGSLKCFRWYEMSQMLQWIQGMHFVLLFSPEKIETQARGGWRVYRRRWEWWSTIMQKVNDTIMLWLLSRIQQSVFVSGLKYLWLQSDKGLSRKCQKIRNVDGCSEIWFSLNWCWHSAVVEAWMVPCQKKVSSEVACASRVKQVSTECSATEWQGKFQQGGPAWPCKKGWQNRCCYSTQQRQISQVPEWGCTTHCWAGMST